MDSTMTIPKFISARPEIDARASVDHRHETTSKPRKPIEDVEVTSLSLDDNDDFGGDPYNHTGSFCAPKFDD